MTRFGGGTVPQLLEALADAGATSATATLPDGSTVTLIVTGLDFVNLAFASAFPNGVPPGTLLFVRAAAA